MVYWWDTIVCFDKNAPVAHPHPDRTFYSFVSTVSNYAVGSQLIHYQIGSIFAGAFGTLGPLIAGFLIGAAIGSIAPGVEQRGRMWASLAPRNACYAPIRLSRTRATWYGGGSTGAS